MPRDGYMGCWSDTYARKHNPWVDFANVPASSNLVYRRFPAPPPMLAIVVPNICHDMHDCSTRAGDDWLRANLPPILAYDAKHDGLLILTWDEAEPDRDGTNHIATLLVGPTVEPGKYAQAVTHYSVLHTIRNDRGHRLQRQRVLGAGTQGRVALTAALCYGFCGGAAATPVGREDRYERFQVARLEALNFRPTDRAPRQHPLGRAARRFYIHESAGCLSSRVQRP